MSPAVTAIFDIGKTNKKFLVFDDHFNLLFEASRKFDEIADDDGFPCDDIETITSWIDNSLVQNIEKYGITHVNFSTYGASLIHLDKHGNVLTPLYNYLKPIPESIKSLFYQSYGPVLQFSSQTASPPLGMLNSGLQLYWLKHTKPEVFSKVQVSLHLPNYLAYRYHQQKVADKTSIGCHTALWNFKENNYHDWVSKEKVTHLLPEAVSPSKLFEVSIKGRKLTCGVGLHDSSAALIPYIECIKKPFVLLSTGTWNIGLNPFSESKSLSQAELKNDTLFFCNHKNSRVKASRLFLGNEHDRQDRILRAYFNKSEKYHKGIAPNVEILSKFSPLKLEEYKTGEDSLSPIGSDIDPTNFSSYDEAYHYLNIRMAASQVKALDRILDSKKIKKIFITGGFIQNEIFLQLLASHYTNKKIKVADLKRASALGAAMVLHPKATEGFSKDQFKFRKCAQIQFEQDTAG